MNSIVSHNSFNPDDTQVDTQVNTQVNTTEVGKNYGVPNYTDKILSFCRVPRSLLEIAEFLNYKQRKSVRLHIIPFVEQGRLAMTIPQSPNSRFQKYITIK